MAMMVTFETGSYRDREGRVFYGDAGEVLRALSVRALAEWEAVRCANFFQQGMETGRIVRTTRFEVPLIESRPGESRAGNRQMGMFLAGEMAPVEPALIESAPVPVPHDGPTWAAFLKHDTIPFVSYPYEWTFGMLKDAALLHLDLLLAALDEDFTLKDGTAYNVQWVGSRPVFIDVLSFEKVTPGQPWAGYRPFCQTFLYPLFLQAYKDVPFQPWLRGCLDGITPEQCANLMSLRDMVRPGVLKHAWLHAWLEGSVRVRESDIQQNLPRAGFNKSLIQANAAALARIIRRLEWNPPDSKWSGYAANTTYSSSDAQRKADFVRAAVVARPAGLVWDLGCNTGEYSRIAAENAECVIAMDGDHLAVERLYQSLRTAPGAQVILPLVSNFADPSPNLGWRGQERKSLAERGRPELTLCLALIHHLVIGAGIPLRELLQWLAALGSRLVIEFVGKDDAMVQQLLRNKRDNYADYDLELFDRWLHEYFEVVRSERLDSGTRALYYAVPKS
jgi:ribosomal protein L11 methylase PrmA